MSTLEELALRCVLPGFAGTEAPEWVRRRAAQGLGGVVLFARNVESKEQVRRLTSRLHSERPELVIAVDEEGGDVTRIEARTGSSYPGNLALGAAGDLALTTDVAAAMGAELAELGIDLDLGPVADVNSNPLNPVIGVRSFGSDPRLVARQTAAWIAGMQGAGVAACAKHFPGHGDTAVDSHLALPVAGEDPRLGALEPFKAAIAGGVRAIMSAHIVAPALDDLPATISPRIMTGLLRDELGFEGVAVSDGLEMAGLTARRTVPEAAVLALAAGCDALCVGGGLDDEATLDAIVAAILEAVKDGRLGEERLTQAASHVAGGLAPPLMGEPPAPRADGEVGLEAARRALCVDGDVHLGAEATVIRLDSSQSIPAGTVPWGMADALAACGVQVAGGRGRVVIAVRSLNRQPENRSQVDDLLGRHPDAVLVEMGVPAYRPPRARAYIATHGSARVCAQAAAEAMTR
jgi:beta-N-acetylhexosaminidase